MFVEQKSSRLAAQKHGKLRELFCSSDSNLQEMLKEAGGGGDLGNEGGGSPSGDVNERARGILRVWEAEKNTSGDEGSVRFISGEAECEDGTWCHRDSRRERWRGGRGGGFGFRLLLHCVSIRQRGSEGLSTGPTFADANLQICSFCHGCFILTSSCVVTEVRMFLKSTAAPDKESTRFHCNVKRTRHAGVRNVRRGGILNPIRNEL